MNWETFGTWAAVVVALVAVLLSFYQTRRGFKEQRGIAKEDREHARTLAEEERRHQSRPILVPDGEISDCQGGFINWQKAPSFNLRNVGHGVALDIKAALYGAENGNSSASNSYAYWHIDPIAPDEGKPKTVIHAATDPSDSIGLSSKASVDGTYLLYNDYDVKYHVARLTLTYRDIFDKHETCYVGVFDYLLLPSGQHSWMHLATSMGIKNDLEVLENQRVPNMRRIRPKE